MVLDPVSIKQVMGPVGAVNDSIVVDKCDGDSIVFSNVVLIGLCACSDAYGIVQTFFARTGSSHGTLRRRRSLLPRRP